MCIPHYTSFPPPYQSKPAKYAHNPGIDPPGNPNPQVGSAWYHSRVDTTITIFRTIPVYIFSLWVGFGVGIGLLWSILPVAAIPSKAIQRFNAALICLLGVLLGGRGGEILLNWSYYQLHPIEIPQVWLGGFSWEGALAGSLVGLLLAAWRMRTSPGQLADGLLPLLTCLATSAWLASWMAGYAYGTETEAWWGLPAQDEWGGFTLRWPTQFTGALATLGLHALIQGIQARRRLRKPGLPASLELAGLMTILLAITPFQAGVTPMWRGVRVATWFAAGTLVLSLGVASAILLRDRLSRTIHKSSGNHEN